MCGCVLRKELGCSLNTGCHELDGTVQFAHDRLSNSALSPEMEPDFQPTQKTSDQLLLTALCFISIRSKELPDSSVNFITGTVDLDDQDCTTLIPQYTNTHSHEPGWDRDTPNTRINRGGLLVLELYFAYGLRLFNDGKWMEDL